MRVLVVEDEPRLAASLRNGLEAEGFAVDVAPDGGEGLWLAREHTYDVVLLDIMLPVLNGYKVCETLRAEGNWTPIVMLTAKDGDWDQVEALDTGADDYVTKPFHFNVLLARIRSLLRRGSPERPVALKGAMSARRTLCGCWWSRTSRGSPRRCATGWRPRASRSTSRPTVARGCGWRASTPTTWSCSTSCCRCSTATRCARRCAPRATGRRS